MKINFTIIRLIILPILFLLFTIRLQAQNVCIGGTEQLTGIGTPASLNPWISSDPLIASVDNNGLVTANALGNCQITFTDNLGNQTLFDISVFDPSNFPSIQGDPQFCDGFSRTLTHSVSGGVWSSSDLNVATVDNTGLVSGISLGACSITYTVTNGACIASTTLSITVVTPNPPTITLTSAVGTDRQVLNVNHVTNANDTLFYDPLIPITYAIGGGATSAYLSSSVSSLPKGVTASFSGGIFTIQGTPYLLYNPTDTIDFYYEITVLGGTNCSDNDTVPLKITGKISLAPACVYNITGPSTSMYCMTSAFSIDFTINYTNATINLYGGESGWLISTNNSTITVSGNNLNYGWHYFQIRTSGGTCMNATKFASVHNDDLPYVQLISPSGTDNQTICLGEAIVPINYHGFHSLYGFDLPSGIQGTSYIGDLYYFGTPNQTGVFEYNILVMSEGACGQSYRTGIITVLPAPSVSSIIGTDSICQSNIVQLSNPTSGGTWSSSDPTIASIDNTGLVTGSSTGQAIISYSVSDGTCSTTKDFAIAIGSEGSALNLSSALGSEIQNLCLNTPITDIVYDLNGSATNVQLTSGTFPIGVSASFNAGQFIISGTPTEAGTFNFTLSTLGSTCGGETTVSGSINVNPYPIALAGGSQQICAGTSALVNGASIEGDTFFWSHNGNGIFSLGENTLTPLYQSTLTDANDTVTLMLIATYSGGCINADTAYYSIYVDPIPSPLTISNFMCLGDSLTVTNTASGGVWSSSNPAVASIDQNGLLQSLSIGTALISYTLSSPSCTNSQSTQITVQELIYPVFNLDSLLCQGENEPVLPLFSENIPALLGSWSGVINTALAGSTTLTFTPSGTACATPYSITFKIDSLPIADYTYDVTVDSIFFHNQSLSASLGFNWNIDGTNYGAQSDVGISYTPGDTILMVLTAYNPCGSDTLTLEIRTSLNGINTMQENLFELFPNPINEFLNIKSKNATDGLQFACFDQLGRLVLQLPLKGMENSINASALTQGMYHYTITDTEKIVQNGKLTKM